MGRARFLCREPLEQVDGVGAPARLGKLLTSDLPQTDGRLDRLAGLWGVDPGEVGLELVGRPYPPGCRGDTALIPEAQVRPSRPGVLGVEAGQRFERRPLDAQPLAQGVDLGVANVRKSPT